MHPHLTGGTDDAAIAFWEASETSVANLAHIRWFQLCLLLRWMSSQNDTSIHLHKFLFSLRPGSAVEI